ncbi:MAG TPA: helix-turn-helix transcriptional regulator [Chloroflexi bacterium]|jgi:DNA-binding transcriptional ArsR family regulator|nr:helix-turn-helix transcriptional regulator [Chloroflexota bacterium]HPO59444.1 helix-turn-helix domain-containing protein [Anaerolineaceae bacterium]
MDRNSPRPTFVIRDLETLRVVVDPLHRQIYEVLRPRPQTIKQVAGQLGLAPSRLYYHFNQMEGAGLIRVVETRQVGNLTEKVYWVVASEVEVDPDLLSVDSQAGPETRDAVVELLSATINTAREDLIRSIAARRLALEQGAEEHPRQVFLMSEMQAITEERAEEFRQRFLALLEEFKAAGSQAEGEDGSDRQAYGLLVAFYPSYYYPEQGE